MLPDSSFWKAKKTGTALHNYCKKCCLETNKEWKRKNPGKCKKSKEEIRDSNLWKKYKIRTEDVVKMQFKQKNRCTICNEKFKNKEPYVDHCHTSEKVRELLCARCNSMTGFFEKFPHLFDKIWAYIKKHKEAINGN